MSGGHTGNEFSFELKVITTFSWFLDTKKYISSAKFAHYDIAWQRNSVTHRLNSRICSFSTYSKNIELTRSIHQFYMTEVKLQIPSINPLAQRLRINDAVFNDTGMKFRLGKCRTSLSINSTLSHLHNNRGAHLIKT